MLSVVLLLSAATGQVAATDVIGQIRAGKVLCTNPHAASKTCSNIDTFEFDANGNLFDTGEVLLRPDQAFTLEVTSVAHIENGAVCGQLEMADLERARIRMNGTLLPPERHAQALNQMVEAMRPMEGRQVCEELRLQSGHLIKYGNMSGARLTLPGKLVAWINPSSGYRVAPR